MTKTSLLTLAILILTRPSLADDPKPKADPAVSMAVEADVASIGPMPGTMAGVIGRYDADRGSVARSAPPRGSAARDALLKRLDESWLKALDSLDFDPMDVEDRVDYVLLKSHLKHGLRQMDLDARQRAEVEPLIPFAPIILDLDVS